MPSSLVKVTYNQIGAVTDTVLRVCWKSEEQTAQFLLPSASGDRGTSAELLRSRSLDVVPGPIKVGGGSDDSRGGGAGDGLESRVFMTETLCARDVPDPAQAVGEDGNDGDTKAKVMGERA
jgi:hypothetical protein